MGTVSRWYDRLTIRWQTALRGSTLVIAGSFLAIGLSACDQPSGQAKEPPPPLEVRVAKPEVKTITEWDEYTGQFDAIERVEIRARVSGYLDDIKFNDGQLVEKDDLLFVIDQRPFLIALQTAEAELEQARASVQRTEKDLERAQTLRQSRNISQSVVDERFEEARIARASLQAAEAAVARARLDLEFTEVKAPISGRIGRELVTRGNLVDGSDSGGTILTTIVSQNPIYFYFEVSETDFLKYARLFYDGSRPTSRESPNPVQVKLLDEDEFVHDGHMDYVDNVIDATSGTLQGRAIIQNPRDFIQPGQFGRLRLPGSGEYEAVMIPDAAIQSDQARKFVLIVNGENTVERRWVTPGPIVDGLRVVREGLTGDENIVVGRLQLVRPGTEVNPIATENVAAETS